MIGVRRGMAVCFEALKLLVPVIPEVRLLLIGHIDKADRPLFDSYMNDAAIRAHTIHYPWKDISEIPSYIAISDVCVSAAINSPQHDSGIGNKIFQYMLFERPVVVTNSKPLTALLDETRCGLIFEDLDAGDMAEKIKTLYRHPEMRCAMGRNGRKAVMEKYNLQMAGKRLGELYRNK
jgi:glycosyltransferase involved in cell wall biosynthesis